MQSPYPTELGAPELVILAHHFSLRAYTGSYEGQSTRTLGYHATIVALLERREVPTLVGQAVQSDPPSFPLHSVLICVRFGSLLR